jgi:hypothetical protein
VTKALKQYLQRKGYRVVFREGLPDLPDEAVALYGVEGGAAVAEDGCVTVRVRIVSRARTLDGANLTALTLAADLDSGLDERVLTLAEGVRVLARPSRWPTGMKRDGKGRALVEFEVTLQVLEN